MLLVAIMALVLPPEPIANGLFTDGMVLQRQRAIPVFGKGPQGAQVKVELTGSVRTTKVQSDGTWRVVFPKREAGGPYSLIIDDKVAATDVYVGEVWVASGQSNMEWSVDAASMADLARRSPDPLLRMFTVPKVSTETPFRDLSGRWQASSESTVGAFSAVAYWFARRLREQLGVPVGIIHTSWGGTPAESWTSRERLRRTPSIANRLLDYEKVSMGDYAQARANYERALEEFNRNRADTGNVGADRGWHAREFDDREWPKSPMPMLFERALGRDFDGAFWLRAEFELTRIPREDTFVSLGPIDDFDTTYVNGEKVGGIGLETENYWSVPRSYRVSPSLLRLGKNSIAVRVFDHGLNGGFAGTANRFGLISSDGQMLAPLAKEWRHQIEREIKVGNPPAEPFGPGNPWVPGGLYNGMIAPLVPYAIRGAIWYQGESNADRAEQYRTSFPAMIEDWRDAWGQGDFPFLLVQLANFMNRASVPGESNWAELRESQFLATRLPNVKIATAIDLGEANDIHPREKRPVGERLAGVALADVYGRPVAAYGPMFKDVKFQGAQAVISFQHAGGLRTTDGRPPAGFAIAGADRRWVWAEARIQGDKILVSAPEVSKPVAVRYAWDINPDVNLVNGAGLPAFPFRTDQWPMVTAGKR
jgi:sialate O-acetylesterase